MHGMCAELCTAYGVVPYGVLISRRRPDYAAQETHELLPLDTQDWLDMRNGTESQHARSLQAEGSCEYQWRNKSEGMTRTKLNGTPTDVPSTSVGRKNRLPCSRSGCCQRWDHAGACPVQLIRAVRLNLRLK